MRWFGKPSKPTICRPSVQLKQMVFVPDRKADVPVRRAVVGAGSHLVPVEPFPERCRRAGGLEWFGRGVVVGLRGRLAVRQAEISRCHCGSEVVAETVAIAAKEAAGPPLGENLVLGAGELGWSGLELDRAADAVPADTDRSNSGKDRGAAHLGGADVGKRRVHVVGARRHHIHAIHLDAHAVVRQAVDRRKAGDTARAVEADAGNVLQKTRAVTRRGPLRGQVLLVEAGGGRRRVGWLGGRNEDWIEHRRCRVSVDWKGCSRRRVTGFGRRNDHRVGRR